MEINIPVSLGELLDKISILEIKNKKILDDTKLVNIKKELSGLRKVLKWANFDCDFSFFECRFRLPK